jgi:hypothetical protein
MNADVSLSNIAKPTKPVVDSHRSKWKSNCQERSRSARGNLLSLPNIPFTALVASRLGTECRCESCGVGASVWFNWQFANKRQTPEDLRRIAFFAQWKELRRGILYHCRICDEVWYLDGKAEQMTHVSSERRPLVLEWDREETVVPSDISEIVERIGPTPSDEYDNEQGRRVTPCKVVTRSGEVFETAMICVQLDAPIQDHMLFRLGSEIAGVSARAFALPREVREASSKALQVQCTHMTNRKLRLLLPHLLPRSNALGLIPAKNQYKPLKYLVSPAGFEPATY